MKLKKSERELMEICPMNPNTLAKLLEILKKVRDLGEPLDNYLKDVMVAKRCLETHVIHKEGDITESAYFIARGFIIVYYFTEEGVLRVVKIIGPGWIAAGQGFLGHKKSIYNLMILKDSLVLEITYEQMQRGYVEVPGMQELAMVTKEDLYDEDLLVTKMLGKTGEQRVIDFYTKFPMLLKFPRLIQDLYIASHLYLSIDHFQHIRSALLKNKILPVKPS